MSQQLQTEAQDKTQQRLARREPHPTAAPSLHGELHPMHQLQRLVGNRRVAQLIQAKRLTPDGKLLGLQRTLTVGAADDPYEQEAERVARHVLNTSDAVAANSMQRALAPEDDKDQRLQTKPLAASITPFVQRQMVNNEELEDKEQPVQAKLFPETSPAPVQRQPETEEDETEPLQAKAAGALTDSFEAGGEVETQLRQSKGRGSPLPDSVRTYMEPRFGADFSGVRVHTGSDSTQLNRSLSAQAFTVGRDIYYGAGKSPTDLSLTAHELTHVVQQTGGGTTQRKLACGEPDIFLRQGEYNPSSRAGQELLVHELTHVVQQDGQQLQRALTQAKEGAATGGAPSEREKAPLNFLSTALSLARLSDREAATLWGQRLTSAIALRQSDESAAASPMNALTVLREASPANVVLSPPEVFEQLKAEAKADALKIRNLLHEDLKRGSPFDVGRQMVAGKKAAWEIIAKWGAKPPDAGYQGRGGYMTPFDFFVSELNMQTFTVEEWFVEQWTNAFELICERMPGTQVAIFKMWVQTHGRLFKDEKPRGMVHFDVGQVLEETGEVYLELGGAFFTAGSSLVAKIAKWLAFDLPKLYQKAKAVIGFVDKIQGIKLDDVKKFLSPSGIGALLVNALFGKAEVATIGSPEEGGKAEEKTEESVPEASGLVALLSKVMRVVNALKSTYNKVNEAINAVLSRLNVTQANWFEPFSMAYAAIVKAVDAVGDPGTALRRASEALRETIGSFFQTIKEKVTEIASNIKGHLDVVGKGKQLIRELAEKAVEMVVNFLIKHNPSAMIKAALRVVEAAAGEPVAKLLREKVPYGKEIFDEIVESDTVNKVLEPLKTPVAALTEMTDSVASDAAQVVGELETRALALVGDGGTILSELAGVKAPEAGAGGTEPTTGLPQEAPAAAGGKELSGFLGVVKHGIHTHLLELGMQSLLRHGKDLAKTGLKKGAAAAKGLFGKVLGRVIPFKARGKQHELWVEQRQGGAVVLVATTPAVLQRRIAAFESRLPSIPESRDKKRIVELLERLRTLNQEVVGAGGREPGDVRGSEREQNAIVRVLQKLVDLAGPEPLDDGDVQSPVGRPAPAPQQNLTRREMVAYLRALWEQHGILHRIPREGQDASLGQLNGLLRQFEHETGATVKWVPLQYISERGGQGNGSVFAEPGSLLINQGLRNDAARLSRTVRHELCAYYAAGGGRQRSDIPKSAESSLPAHARLEYMINFGGPANDPFVRGVEE